VTGPFLVVFARRLGVDFYDNRTPSGALFVSDWTRYQSKSRLRWIANRLRFKHLILTMATGFDDGYRTTTARIVSRPWPRLCRGSPADDRRRTRRRLRGVREGSAQPPAQRAGRTTGTAKRQPFTSASVPKKAPIAACDVAHIRPSRGRPRPCTPERIGR
jgi:hypothetical protein